MIVRGQLDDLVAFACVARTRSFTRAASEMGVSTSNLSHIVKRLERRLGVRVLQRTSRSVSPTEAGEALLKTLDPAIASIGDALDELQRHRATVSGTLRITATREAYELVIRPVLPEFTAAHPDATIEVMIDYGFRDIVADRCDAGIRLGEKLQADMIATRVGPDLRMAVVASPAYLAANPVPQHPRDLMRHRCINYRMVTSGTIYAWEFERKGEQVEVQVSGPLTFNDPTQMLDCARDGIGVAFVLEHEAARDVASGTLVRLMADWTPPFPGFFLYYPSRRQPRPALTALIRLAKGRLEPNT